MVNSWQLHVSAFNGHYQIVHLSIK